MAILSNLLVNGESRLLGKLYTNDIEIGNDLTVVNQVTAKRLYIDTDYNPSNLTTSNSDSAPFAVGKKTGKHIAIDADEIAAKSNATTRASLYLNYGGGTVYLSNGTAIYADNGTLRAATVIAATSLGNTSNYVPNAYITTATITTGNITTANTNNIYNTGNIYNKNGRIETDVIRSNVWDIVSTQNLGGSFIVAPTIMIKDGSTVTITSVSGTTIVGSIKDTTNITSDSFGGHTWSQNSKIKITGKLTSGNDHYVLGTCDGTLTAKMNTTSNTINFSVTCNASTLPPNGTYTITGGTVMMYNVGGSNLVGIELTSYGTDKYTYIDIYNGSNGIKPVARLGKLDNLSTATYGNIKVNGDNLTGYGIYTNNGFFEGKIVSSSGKIGGFNIGTSAIYSTTNALGTTDNNVYIGTEGISLGTTFKVTKGGTLTATSGSIAGWRIESNYLASGTATGPGTDILMLSPNGTTSSYTIAGQSKTGWMITAGTTFGVNKDGGVYATSGLIGGFTIGTSDIHNGKTSKTETTNNGVWVGTDGIGFGKGITYFSDDGTGKIGPWTLSTTYLRNGNIAGANNTTVAGVYLGTDGLNISGGSAANTAYIYKNGSNVSVNIGNKLTWNGTTLAIDGTATIGGTAASTVVSNASSAKTAIDNLEIGGTNLFVTNNGVDGYLNGTPSSISAMSSTNREQTSDWISVDGFSFVTIQTWYPDHDDQLWIGYAFYTDKDMTKYVAGRVAKYGNNYLAYVGVEVPATAKYMRVSYRRWQGVLIKVEKGNQATDWTPAPEDGNPPILTKSYTGIIATANDDPNGTLYFGNVIPIDYYTPWKIKYRISAKITGVTDGFETSEVVFNGAKDAYYAYQTYNSTTNTSYRPYYYHVLYTCKSAGIKYGHLIGINLRYSYNPTTTANSRDVSVEILEAENCTVTLSDSMFIYANAPGTGPTNYANRYSVDGSSQGFTESGDRNETNHLLNNFGGKTGANGVWATGLFMRNGSGAYESICTASGGTATSGNRTINTDKKANANGFEVGGQIYYCGSSYNANTNMTSNNVYGSMGVFDSRYSVNSTDSSTFFTAYQPIYLVGNIKPSDGLFYLDSTWWTQTPNDTTKIYVLIGTVIDRPASGSTYYWRISLREDNSWLMYDGSKLVDISAAMNYITQIDSNGIWVTPSSKKPTNASSGAGATGTKIDGTNGVQIYDNGIKLAEYSSGIKLYQPDGTEVVNISTAGATFKGAINATSGFIGENSTNGFNISSKSIWNGISTQNAASGTGIYLGTDGINLGGGKFNVTKTGFLTSTNGAIGGWTVSDKYLYTLNNSLYTTLKKDGDVAFAAGSPDYNSGIGANLIIGHDGSLKAGKMQDAYSAGSTYSLQVYSIGNIFNNSDMLVLNGSGSLGSFLSMSEYYEDEDLIVHELYTQISRTGGFESEGYDYTSDNNVYTHYTQIYNGIIKTDGINNQEGQNIYGRKVFNNPDAFYIYGNNAMITRIATQSHNNNNPGLGFMIGNGYYAAGSADNGVITDQNNSMYLVGGCDGSGYYLRSYPTYNRKYTASANMHITDMGTIGRATSSSVRYKHDVEYYTNKDNSTIDKSKILITKKKSKESPESILNIPIVTFKYNEGYVTGEADFDYEKPILGLIAEDVAKICPECATYIKDDDGNEIPEAWDEKAVLVRLLYVVQKQNEMIKELQKEVQK